MTNLVIQIHLWSQALQLQWVIMAAICVALLWAFATVRFSNG
jgi:hypothetical protein